MPDGNFTPGQYVYHRQHGTARYLGLKEIDASRYLELEYAAGDKLYVPLANEGLVESVPTDGAVRVDRLRKSGPPPPPPRALIRHRASVSAGGPGIATVDDAHPLLAAARDASPERRGAVDRARQKWISRLIDLSRRNRLLYYQPLKVRTVELAPTEITRALPLISGESVPVARVFAKQELVHGDEDVELTAELDEVEDLDLGVIRRLQEIQKRGDEDFEERGLETVYFAYGMATWTPEDSGRPPMAPVLLVPLAITGRGNRLTLTPQGDIEVNLTLTHVLEEDYGCEGLAEGLDELLAETDETAASVRAEQVFDRIIEAGQSVPGFRLDATGVIGNFAFQKLAMVRDLQAWAEHMVGHDIVAAVAEDPAAKSELAERRADVDPRELDRRPPDDEFLVMDADSSQLRAIAGIVAGQSGVVIGPPGTGKSQTIANLIGEMIARGKRVLFVSEKRAALNVVKDRLERRGLGDMILDLHGAVSRKQIMAQFSTALEVVSSAARPRVEDLHRSFVAHRDRLNEYVERLHRRREPSGYSAYELIGHFLAAQMGGDVSAVRWKGKALKSMTREQVAKIEEALRRGAAEPMLFLRRARSPWTNAALTDRGAVESAVEAADRISDQLLPEFLDVLRDFVEQCRLNEPATLGDVPAMFEASRAANQLLANYKPELFNFDLERLAIDLAPSKTPMAGVWAAMVSRPYRVARDELLAIRASRVRARLLLEDLNEAMRVRERWVTVGAAEGRPIRYQAIERVEVAYEALSRELTELGRTLSVNFGVMDLEGLSTLVSQLASDRTTPPKIPALRRYESEVMDLGAGPLLDELREEGAPPESWMPRLRYAWLASCWDQLLLEEPDLAVFNATEHAKAIEEFQRLDRERIEIAIERVRRAYGESVVAAANRYKDEHLLLKKQAALRSRHLPFRELVGRAPNVVTAVKPCWMASPLAVSQLLAGTAQPFDLVIFDEASQVLPEDAITSILRANAVVVAGDPNQLPPTQFFAAERDDDGDPGEDTEGFESILDVMVSFLPQWPLDWHYRSRDERLIAFSNHYIYDDRLVTFPSADHAVPALRHVLVEQLRLDDAEEQSSSAEVAKVVELILEHAEMQPELSLGVIAMGIKHSNRVAAELERARRLRPELDAFFEGHPDEKFFVKNLERVQGDERDAIILTIGYGKDASGKLPYRFGPLLSEGGHRRLNVAVTRAKQALALVSSFGHYDMDPARSSKRGVELMRLYLEYAASGGHVFGDGGPAAVERNEFEVQVQEALEREGLILIPQFGASKYRLDMVVQDPSQPGRYVLAIECDGATYHSAPTARDRDRLRQEHLEARGWRFVRIWSTDWFSRRDDEIKRVLAVYRSRLNGADGGSRAGALGMPAHTVTVASTVKPPNGSAVQRPPRPAVPRGLNITDYSRSQLQDVARWIRSDEVLRTDEELLEAMMEDLWFERRGRRIEAALMEAIAATRPRVAGGS